MMAWNKHQKKSRLRRHETTTWKVFKSRGCSCDINQTRLERNENVVVAEKPTWSYNTIFDYTCRYEIKKELSLYIYSNWSCEFNKNAATTAILTLTLSSGRNNAHGKGTKLTETGRYLVRCMRPMGVFPSPLRCAEIATPAQHG